MTATEISQRVSYQANRWVANVILGYGDAALGGLVFIVLTPIIIRFLGTDVYALWIFGHVICFYLQFLDVGLSAAQIRYHARFAARRRSSEIQKLSSTILVGMTVAGAVGMLGGMLIALVPAGWWRETSSGLQGDFRLALSLLAVNLLVTFPGTALNNIYAGAQRFDVRNLRSIALRIVATAVQLCLLFYGYGIVALAALELALTCSRMMVDILIINRLVPGLLQTPVRFHPDIWRRIRRFALWSSADEILVEGTPRLDQLFLAMMLPIGLLTPYSLCTSMAGALMLAINPIISTFFPMASMVHAQNKSGRLRQMLVEGSKLCLTLATPAAIFFAFFGERILGLWVPESSGQIPIGLLQLIIANVLTSVFLATPAVILTAINGVRAVVILTLSELSLSFVLILSLTPSLGVTGIAASCLLTNIGAGFCFLLPIVARALKQKTLQLLRESLGGVVLAAIPTLAVASALARWWREADWAQLLLAAFAIGGLFVLAMWLIGTNRKEREHYWLLWRGLRNAPDEAEISIVSRG